MLKHFSNFLVLMTFFGASLTACSAAEQASGEITTDKNVYFDEGSQSIQLNVKLSEPFVRETTWIAATPLYNDLKVVMISSPVDQDEVRIVEPSEDKGYTVYRGVVSCPQGIFMPRDSRSATFDKNLPLAPSKKEFKLDLTSTLSKICRKEARLPVVRGDLFHAISQARKLNKKFDNIGPDSQDGEQINMKSSNYIIPEEVIIEKKD